MADTEAGDEATGGKRIVEGAGVLTISDNDVSSPGVAYRVGEVWLEIGHTPAVEPGSRNETCFAFAVFGVGDEHDRSCLPHFERESTIDADSARP